MAFSSSNEKPTQSGHARNLDRRIIANALTNEQHLCHMAEKPLASIGTASRNKPCEGSKVIRGGFDKET
jgi:hypothetical protein